jgi:hypothetical protein
VQAWKHGCECELMVKVKEREGRGMEWGQEGQRAWGHSLMNRDRCI